jgi:hypothetical protein
VLFFLHLHLLRCSSLLFSSSSSSSSIKGGLSARLIG